MNKHIYNVFYEHAYLGRTWARNADEAVGIVAYDNGLDPYVGFWETQETR